MLSRHEPPWRNGLACWTSNSKVVGSSPTGGWRFPFFKEIFKMSSLGYSSLILQNVHAFQGQFVSTTKSGKMREILLAPPRRIFVLIRRINRKSALCIKLS